MKKGAGDLCYYLKSIESDFDDKIENPYLEDLINIVRSSKTLEEADLRLHESRNSMVEKYSFSIPFPDILEILKRYSPITELGAGTGYYSYCLRQTGADVEAYDLYSPDDADPFDFMGGNQWFEDTWIMVISGNEDVVRSCGERSLFLCWPPPESLMAFNALKILEKANGKYLIYIGDKRSSAEERFFRELENHHMEVDMAIPSWRGIQERLMIYRLRNLNES